MTKIYLIKHLDSGMKYVGITDGDLAKRWQQHYNDPNSAVYSALRSEGYRMTMELLEDVPSRDEALRKEQEYIRTLGTAQPHGWNRMVSKVEVVKPAVKKWIRKTAKIVNCIVQRTSAPYGTFLCPKCGGDNLSFDKFDIYQSYCNESSKGDYIAIDKFKVTTKSHYLDFSPIEGNPPDGYVMRLCIDFRCFHCHWGENEDMPLFGIEIGKLHNYPDVSMFVSYYEEVTQ
jgi:hypothetical protein